MNQGAECEAIWDMLSAYADGEATPEEARIVEAHVAACLDCARDLQFMRETSQMLALTPEIAPPPGLQEAILAATTRRPTWRERVRTALSRSSAPRYRRLAWVGSAACALALIGAGWITLRQPDSPSSRLAMQSPPIYFERQPEPETSVPAPSQASRPLASGSSSISPARVSSRATQTAGLSRVRPSAPALRLASDSASSRSPLRRLNAPNPVKRTETHVASPPSDTEVTAREDSEKIDSRTDTQNPTDPGTLITTVEHKTEVPPARPSESPRDATDRTTIRLVASAPADLEAISSLADLRRTLRREQASGGTWGETYALNRTREVRLDFIKTRF
jgi:hypothetical protein